jgi:hypothetical protein
MAAVEPRPLNYSSFIRLWSLQYHCEVRSRAAPALVFTARFTSSAENEDEPLYAWETCSNKIQSMRRLVFVTLLLTVLISAQLLRASLMQLVAQKAFGIAAVNGSIVEALTMFVLGSLVCTVIYSACALYEGALSRRKDTMEPFGHQHCGSSVKRLRPSRC